MYSGPQHKDEPDVNYDSVDLTISKLIWTHTRTRKLAPLTPPREGLEPTRRGVGGGSLIPLTPPREGTHPSRGGVRGGRGLRPHTPA